MSPRRRSRSRVRGSSTGSTAAASSTRPSLVCSRSSSIIQHSPEPCRGPGLLDCRGPGPLSRSHTLRPSALFRACIRTSVSISNRNISVPTSAVNAAVSVAVRIRGPRWSSLATPGAASRLRSRQPSVAQLSICALSCRQTSLGHLAQAGRWPVFTRRLRALGPPAGAARPRDTGTLKAIDSARSTGTGQRRRRARACRRTAIPACARSTGTSLLPRDTGTLGGDATPHWGATGDPGGGRRGHGKTLATCPCLRPRAAPSRISCPSRPRGSRVSESLGAACPSQRQESCLSESRTDAWHDGITDERVT